MNGNVRTASVSCRLVFAAMGLLAPAVGAAQDAGMTMPMPAMPTPNISSDASMQNMDMHDDAPHTMLLVDQLEYAYGYGGNGPAWEAEAWYGNDSNKVWLRSEGEGTHGRIGEGDIEALWSHAVSAFWNTQLGLRHDVGIGPQRNWAAFGLEGLTPCWVELESTVYASESGRLAARVRAEYSLRFTQRWILQPEFEANGYSKNDPGQRLGDDTSNAQLGLRLRYEITRQLAPYLGVVWTRRFGSTTEFGRAGQQPVFDRQWVVGIRLWL